MSAPRAIHLEIGGRRLLATFVPGEAFAIVFEPCDRCGSDRICGNGEAKRETDRDFSEDAVCFECRHPAGRIVVDRDTIFGAEEDGRVLGGAWKVY